MGVEGEHLRFTWKEDSEVFKYRAGSGSVAVGSGGKRR